MAHSTITLPEFLFPFQNAKKSLAKSVLNTRFQTTKNTATAARKSGATEVECCCSHQIILVYYTLCCIYYKTTIKILYE
jgi:hypothetical protein